MRVTTTLLILATLGLSGCNQPIATGPVKVAPTERAEVIARRAALEVSLSKQRSEWAMKCIDENRLPVFAESDRPVNCRRNADYLYPDMITQQLLSEFQGDLVTPTKPKEQ